MLLLRSPQEDPLSAKRVQRRVQAFVMLAIVVFVAGGVAANHYFVAANRQAPETSPVRDAVVGPDLDASAGPSVAPPKHRKATPKHRKPHPSRSKSAKKTKPAALSAAASAEEAAVRLTNAQRTAHGCSPLRTEQRLRSAARSHSADMRDRHYFDHNTPNGKSPWDRIKAAGYSMPGAENIANGYATAKTVVQGWMNSAGHRANILNCDLKAVGIGIAYGPGGPWWTQDFGFR